MKYYDKLIFELSKEGRTGYSLREPQARVCLPEKLARKEAPELPQVSVCLALVSAFSTSQTAFGEEMTA